MPRSRATIQFAIWRDKEFRALSPTAQLAYFMLVSQRDVSQAGTMPLVPERWARGCDSLPVDHLEVGLGELEQARFVYIDDDTEELLIRSLIRNDGIADQPNVLLSAIREAKITESDLLRRVLASELRRVRKGIPADADKGRGRARAAIDEALPELENGADCRTLPEPSEVYPRTLFATLGEPYENPSNPSRTLGGGGGGGGVVTSPSSSTYCLTPEPERRGVSRDADLDEERANPPALVHDDGTPTPAGVVREWERASGSPLTDTTRAAMRIAVSQCQRAGHDPQTIAQGLADWAASPITATSQIPSFIDRAAVRPHLAPAHTPAKKHNADEWLELGERMAAERGR